MARREGEPSLRDLMMSSRPIKSRKFNVSEEYASNNLVYEGQQADADNPAWTDYRITRKDGETHSQYAQRAKNAAREILVAHKPVERPWGERLKEAAYKAIFGSQSAKEKKDSKWLSDVDRLASRLMDKKNRQDLKNWVGNKKDLRRPDDDMDKEHMTTVQTISPPQKFTWWQSFMNLFGGISDPKEERQKLPPRKHRH